MKTYGEFVKFKPDTEEELRRTAYTPGEAVQFRFDGWEQVQPLPDPRPFQDPAAKPQAAAKPKNPAQ